MPYIQVTLLLPRISLPWDLMPCKFAAHQWLAAINQVMASSPIRRHLLTITMDNHRVLSSSIKLTLPNSNKEVGLAVLKAVTGRAAKADMEDSNTLSHRHQLGDSSMSSQCTYGSGREEWVVSRSEAFDVL